MLVPGQARPGAHGADVGQHRHRPGHGVPGQGLPPQGRDADGRVGGAPPAARVVGGRDHRVAGDRGLQRGRPHGPAGWPRSTPSGCSSTSTATRPTPRRTTRAPVPRSCRDCPGITHFVAGLGTSGTLLGVGPLPAREARRRRVDLGRRAAGGRDGRRPAQPRRRLHPADLRGPRRRGAARPQDRGASPRVDRVDAALDRGGRVRRDLYRARRWPAR